MPSNTVLIEEAEGLAARLGATVETKGLNNAKLVDLVKDLRAKVTDAETKTQADAGGEPVALLGSDKFDNEYTIGDDLVTLGDLVGGAFEKSELTVEAWNELPAEVRDELIGNELTARSVQAEAEKAKADVAKGKKARPKKPPYYVAPGKALTSKKGILSGDNEAEVKPEYLAGGQTDLDAFVESGHVLKG